jgi:TRAP-type C4-dicarboxylate transport system substrate-binding protein
VIELKLADILPATHDLAIDWILPFIDSVTELTNGQVEIEHYAAGSLLAGTEVLQGTRMGIADLSWMPVDWYPDVIPLSNVQFLPYIWDSQEQGTWVYERLVKQGLLKEEFANIDIIPLGIMFAGTPRILWISQVAKTLEDVQKLKFRAMAAESKVMDALGIPTVVLGMADALEGMRTGVVDGMSQPWWVVKSYSLDELAKCGLNMGMYTANVNLIIMRGEAFRELSPDLQEALIEAGDRSTQAWPVALARLDEVGKSLIKDANIPVHEWSEEELEHAKMLTESVVDEWKEDSGKDADSVLEQVKILKRLYTEQQ